MPSRAHHFSSALSAPTRLAVTLFTGALALASVGCASSAPAESPTGDAVEVLRIDNCGTEVLLQEPPRRIVTIKSSALELLLALGVGDRVIGTAFPDGPVPDELADEAAGVPIISDKVPSQEAVLESEPDFVFAGWESNFSIEGVGERPTLTKLGVTTYVAPAACKAPGYMPDPLTFETVFEGFTEAGLIFDAEDAAAELVHKQSARLAEIVPDKRGLTAVWYSSGRDQPFVGAGIGAPEMIMSAAGLSNVFTDVEESWTSTSWELVAERDPSVIVLVDSAWNTAQSKVDLLKANPVTATLDAVIEDRFVIVDFAATEAGIRNIDAVEAIVEQLGAL